MASFLYFYALLFLAFWISATLAQCIPAQGCSLVRTCAPNTYCKEFTLANSNRDWQDGNGRQDYNRWQYGFTKDDDNFKPFQKKDSNNKWGIPGEKGSVDPPTWRSSGGQPHRENRITWTTGMRWKSPYAGWISSVGYYENDHSTCDQGGKADGTKGEIFYGDSRVFREVDDTPKGGRKFSFSIVREVTKNTWIWFRVSPVSNDNICDHSVMPVTIYGLCNNPSCPPNSIVCTDPDSCQCAPGFTGPNCTPPSSMLSDVSLFFGN